MSRAPDPLKPRKTPVQARSLHTVESIFQATILVLLDGGMSRLTTTRVAERAGVSVGSLYQYFPNRRALLAAVLDWHLLQVSETVEAGCLGARGLPVAVMSAALVEAFVDAKFRDAAASRALYVVTAEVEGGAMVARANLRWQQAVGDMLATAPDACFDDPAITAYVVTLALLGPIKGLLDTEAPRSQVDEVRRHLAAMTTAYLRDVGVTRAAA